MIRAAVLYFPKNSQSKLKAVSEALAEGLRNQGAQVDLINGVQTRELKLTGYHYLAIGCDVRSLFKGALAPELATCLGNSGIVAGKKAFAYVSQAALGTSATLMKLMRALEHEGIMVRFSEILNKPADATTLGKALKLG